MMEQQNITNKNSATALFAFKAQNTDEVSRRDIDFELTSACALVIIFKKRYYYFNSNAE